MFNKHVCIFPWSEVPRAVTRSRMNEMNHNTWHLKEQTLLSMFNYIPKSVNTFFLSEDEFFNSLIREIPSLLGNPFSDHVFDFSFTLKSKALQELFKPPEWGLRSRLSGRCGNISHLKPFRTDCVKPRLCADECCRELILAFSSHSTVVFLQIQLQLVVSKLGTPLAQANYMKNTL